jgi:predicted transcriptional regulator
MLEQPTVDEGLLEKDPSYLPLKNAFQILLIKRYLEENRNSGLEKVVLEEKWVDDNSKKFRSFFDDMFLEQKETMLKILKERGSELEEYVSRLETNIKAL